LATQRAVFQRDTLGSVVRWDLSFSNNDSTHQNDRFDDPELAVALLWVRVFVVTFIFWGLSKSFVTRLGGPAARALCRITIGYHRLWSHRAFRAHKAVRFVLAILGTMAFQGSIKVSGSQFHIDRPTDF
jgi:fatty-acid desaturase